MLDDQANLRRREFLVHSGIAAIAGVTVTGVSGCNSSNNASRNAPPKTSTTGRSPVTALVYDPIYTKHFAGPGHPESPRRLEAIMGVINETDFAGRLEIVKPRDASDDEILAVHSKRYLAQVRSDITSGKRVLSMGDTGVCADSLAAAFKAAGGICLAVDQVVAGKYRNAFCAVRPPGHHSGENRGSGFCVFNNVAIAARHARKKHNMSRVLIADWDVHHGNGTQEAFYSDPSVFFFSTHQWPLYPGTGRAGETGEGKGAGTTINCPFPAGAGREQIVGAFRDKLIGAADLFKPELVLISAGFDSRLGDPLGGFCLTDEDFAELTGIMLDIARKHASGRLVSTLEGGYNPAGQAKAVCAHCQKLASAEAQARGQKGNSV